MNQLTAPFRIASSPQCWCRMLAFIAVYISAATSSCDVTVNHWSTGRPPTILRLIQTLPLQ